MSLLSKLNDPKLNHVLLSKKKKEKEKQLICGCCLELKNGRRSLFCFVLDFWQTLRLWLPLVLLSAFFLCLTTRYFFNVVFFLFDILYLSIFPIFFNSFIYFLFVSSSICLIAGQRVKLCLFLKTLCVISVSSNFILINIWKLYFSNVFIFFIDNRTDNLGLKHVFTTLVSGYTQNFTIFGL